MHFINSFIIQFLYAVFDKHLIAFTQSILLMQYIVPIILI